MAKVYGYVRVLEIKYKMMIGRSSHRTNSITASCVKVAVTGQDAYGHNCERLTSINPGIYSSSAMGNA